MRALIRFFVLPLVLFALCAQAQTSQDAGFERSRIFVLTDIGPKLHPDDRQSLVRLLVYSNHFDIEGLVASTAAMRDRGVHLDYVLNSIAAYAMVRDNLLKHETGFPTAKSLREVAMRGHDDSGMDAVGIGQDSEGSDGLIRAADREDPRPLWVLVWGGTNVLAQALWKTRRNRSEAEFDKFLGKLRVYAIGDQDDSGPWIREQFPSLFLVVSPHGYTEPFANLKAMLTLGHRYKKSTFWGIGAELEGANNTVTSDDWLTENVIVDHGPLGKMYPNPRFVMEADTPSFLYLVNNGLNVPAHPEYGGWGGRYTLHDSIFQDAQDTVIGEDGKMYTSNHATIWRWREAFQNDFAARMDWTFRSYENANHPPVVKLAHPNRLSVSSGQLVELDATPSMDPDDDTLHLRWTQYLEAGRSRESLTMEPATGFRTQFRVPAATNEASFHIILAVTDSGVPPLTRYQRIVLSIQTLDE